MDSLYLLIPIALVFCVIAIKLLLWAINSGQYDDLDKEAWRILADEKNSQTPQAPSTTPPQAQPQPGHVDSAPPGGNDK